MESRLSYPCSDLVHKKPDHQEKNVNVHCDETMLLKELKTSHYCNPLIAYLNINSLRYKIIEIRELLDYVYINFISIGETKSDDFFLLLNFILIVIFGFGGIESMVEVSLPLLKVDSYQDK